MNFQEIKLLLDMVAPLGQLPHLDKIRKAVDDRLREINDQAEAPKSEPKTEDQQRFTPQPKVPDPDPKKDLSVMNHPASERIENRKDAGHEPRKV